MSHHWSVIIDSFVVIIDWNSNNSLIQIKQRYEVNDNDVMLRSCSVSVAPHVVTVVATLVGIMAVEDKRGSLSRHHRSFDTINDDESIFPGSRHTGSGPGSPSSLGQSIFDYVEKQSAKSPIFYNFCFSVGIVLPSMMFHEDVCF